jgi:syntaxin-binding protein 1
MYLDGTHYKYAYSSKTEGQKDKEIILDELIDPIWRDMRHMHIAEAINFTIGSFNRFLSDNRAAAGMTGKVMGAGGVASLKELKDTLSAVPQFQDLKSKVRLNYISIRCCLLYNVC